MEYYRLSYSDNRAMAVITQIIMMGGKLEIKSLQDDQNNSKRVIIGFIKLPIPSSKMHSVSTIVGKYKNQVLASGKINVEKDKSVIRLVGAIRIKKIIKLDLVLEGLFTRMSSIIYGAKPYANRTGKFNSKTKQSGRSKIQPNRTKQKKSTNHMP